MPARRVVLDEHYLRTGLKRETFFGRVVLWREFSLHLGGKNYAAAGKFAQFILVIAVGHAVVCGQPDVPISGTGSKQRLAAAVQKR